MIWYANLAFARDWALTRADVTTLAGAANYLRDSHAIGPREERLDPEIRIWDVVGKLANRLGDFSQIDAATVRLVPFQPQSEPPSA